MKHTLSTLSLLILGGTLALGQNNDPSYSVHNYKHPDKAAYAKKHNMEESSDLVVNVYRQNDNYKQSFRKQESTEKVLVKTKDKDKRNRSYKHPYGL
jgi:hypothetical protein